MNKQIHLFENEFKNHRIRIWLNNPPPISMDIIDSFEHQIRPKIPILLKSNISIVVEMNKNQNASNYALLGAMFIPSDNEVLQVKGLISQDTGRVLLDNMAKPNDMIQIGIPFEYAQAISNITLSFKYYANLLPTGHLLFNLGAHAAVGSSKAIFANVTRLIYRLLIADVNNLNLEEKKIIIHNHLYE
ncbi:hypothetical protein [Paenibacillus sp. P36]|uniref:hypothetical protein n=1 Tax=Paenibacillus sp. P36 TaxID=3342538 RepID=UPI0038B2D479